MSTNNFEEYKTFTNSKQVKDFMTLLDQNQIEYKVEKITPVLDPAFAGNTQNERLVIKLKPNDFLRADKVVMNDIDLSPEELDPDYYLLHFSDDELMDVVVKKDEWNDFDYILALKLLKKRGKEISPDVLETIRRQRQADLSRHLPFPKLLIIAGYIFALFGGLISIFIGLQLLWETKKLPDGSKMYAYNPSVKNHGKLIFSLGLIFLIFTLLFNLREEFVNVFNR
jgi:hypothetical protein